MSLYFTVIGTSVKTLIVEAFNLVGEKPNKVLLILIFSCKLVDMHLMSNV